MVGRIRTAALADGSAEQAVAILTLIAGVEAAIHQVPIEDVHFHEIADWDLLLDVVAAGSIAAALPAARWTVSPLPRGGGLVKTQHGLLPVPAPATAALLTGFAWRDDGVGGERVTPTGAAILRHLVGAERQRFIPGRQAGFDRHGRGHKNAAGHSERSARPGVRGRTGARCAGTDHRPELRDRRHDRRGDRGRGRSAARGRGRARPHRSARSRARRAA